MTVTSRISPLSPKVIPMLNEHDSFPGLSVFFLFYKKRQQTKVRTVWGGDGGCGHVDEVGQYTELMRSM